jgi:predicted transporter
MELKTLFIGIIFALALFGVKSGVGIHYFLVQKKNAKARFFFLSLYSLLYLVLFMLCSHLLQKGTITPYLEATQRFFKSGLFLHTLMAGGLAVWGTGLLKKGDRLNKGSYGWLVLVVPCPVSLTVIFLMAAFLTSYFPDSGYMPVLWGYVVFIGIVLVTVIDMKLWGYKSSSTPEPTMGASMLIIALYFLLSVLVIPHFRDIDKIYRIATYEGETQTTNPRDLLFLYSTMAALFTGGFFIMVSKLRGKKPCT